MPPALKSPIMRSSLSNPHRTAPKCPHSGTGTAHAEKEDPSWARGRACLESFLESFHDCSHLGVIDRKARAGSFDFPGAKALFVIGRGSPSYLVALLGAISVDEEVVVRSGQESPMRLGCQLLSW